MTEYLTIIGRHMATAPRRIMRKPSVKVFRKRLSGRVPDHPDKTRAISTVGILFPGPDMQGVEHRPVRALDPMELKWTDPLRLRIQAYCFFSSGGAACEVAAAPAGAFVSGSARNLSRTALTDRYERLTPVPRGFDYHQDP